MIDDIHHSHADLSPADAQAIDALIDAGLDASLVPEKLKTRAAHAAGLFALLHGTCKTEPALVDVTLARVQRAGAPGCAEVAESALCAEDAEALDAYVAADFRAAKVAASLRPRAERIDAMVRLISKTPAHATAAPGLVDRAMRRIATNPEPNLEPIPIRGFGRFRLADLVSIAAVLVMGVAVLWPILSTVRTYQQKGACAANLGTVASAMGTYTGDSKDSFPMATASYGGSWMDVGTTPDRSNSSNLFTLAKAGYARLRDLACAGNSKAVTQPPSPDAKDWASLPEVSYSYYIMFGNQRPTMGAGARTVILADKSPAVIRAANFEPIRPHENSPNHGGQGQYALFSDGSMMWLSSPNVGDDNIWLNKQQEAAVRQAESLFHNLMPNAPKGTRVEVSIPMPVMLGNELPASRTDSFLGP